MRYVTQNWLLQNILSIQNGSILPLSARMLLPVIAIILAGTFKLVESVLVLVFMLLVVMAGSGSFLVCKCWLNGCGAEKHNTIFDWHLTIDKWTWVPAFKGSKKHSTFCHQIENLMILKRFFVDWCFSSCIPQHFERQEYLLFHEYVDCRAFDRYYYCFHSNGPWNENVRTVANTSNYAEDFPIRFHYHIPRQIQYKTNWWMQKGVDLSVY